MSDTFYCVGCDDFSHFEGKNGICECGTYKEKLLTHKESTHFRWACDWIKRHTTDKFADQPLNVVEANYRAYVNFIDYPSNRMASFQRSVQYDKLVGEMFVHSVTPEQAAQNLKDVIKWRLSDAMGRARGEEEYEVGKVRPLFPKTNVEIRACLKWIGGDTNYVLVKSYLNSLLV